MTTALTLICATCNGPISPEDLAQGLAVRVDGQTICPMCVDLLPGRAQFEINKLRALKGFNATTYRVMVPSHQDHQRFTFTTAGNVMGHYRTLHSDGEFVAPLLPESARHARSPSARPASRAGSAVFAAPQPPAEHATSKASTHPWLIYAVFTCAVLLCALIAVAFWQQHARGLAGARAGSSVEVAKKSRGDYPSDPLEAWEMGSTDGHCPPEVLSLIDQQLRQQLTTDMDQAQGDISQHAYSAAEADLGAVHVPDEASFAALNQRARQLTALLSSARQPPTPAVAAPTPVHDPEPEAEPPTVAGVAPPAPVVAPKPPPTHPLQAPSGECWLMAASELVPPGSTDWSQEGLLRGSSGHLQRTLPPMQGGSYQVWVHADVHSAQPGSLILLIDNQVIDTLSARQADGFLWHALTPQTHLSPGSHHFQIEAAGSGWRVSQVYLASLNQGPPDSASAPKPVPWPAVAPAEPAAAPDPQVGIAAPAPVEEQRLVQEWKASFTWPKNLLSEVMDGSSNLPSPWPSGGTPFVRAQSFTADGDGTLVLRVLKKDVVQGGMVLLLHPMRFERKNLAVRVEWTPDAAEVALKKPNFINLDPLVFSSEAWQVFPIVFPELDHQPDQLRLRLSDTQDFGADLRGFLLGSAVTVSHGPPAVQDLHLLSSPLLSSDVITDADYQRKLVSIMSQVVAHRKGGHLWNEGRYFNPLQCRFIIAKGNPEWMTAMKTRLSQIDTAKVPHNGLYAALDANPQWMGDLDSVDRLPTMDATDVSLAVVMLNGQEGLNRLRDPELLVNWVRKLCTGLVEGAQGKGGGVLPVFVIGATTTTVAGQQQSIDKAWGQVMEFCFENGIPLLDIRNAQFAEGDTPESLSVRLLGDGLQALFYQLRWLQRHVKP